MHCLVVLLGPVVDEPLGHVLLGAPGGADRPEDECDQRNDGQWQGALAQAPLALCEGSALRPWRPVRSPGRLRLPIAGP
jgi:hypothetical protein